MTVFAIDIIDFALGEKNRKGFKFTRRAYIVDPTEQSGRADDAARIFEAIEDTGVPEIGDSHPNVANCLLARIRAVAIDKNSITLDLIYETPDANYQIQTLGQVDISMDSSLLQTETTKLFDGSRIPSLAYTYHGGVDQNPAEPIKDNAPNILVSDFTAISEIPVAPIYIPARIYTIKKRLTGVNEDELEALNETHQRTVNDATWRDLYDPRTWLCIGLSWRTTDFRTTFDTTTRFQYKFDSFDVEAIFKDPYSGKVPGDVFSQGGAFKLNRIQPESDFDALLSALGV